MSKRRIAEQSAPVSCVTPVEYTLPDGRVVKLRGSAGAKRLVRDKYGSEFQRALAEHGEQVCFYMLWAMMHDHEGRPLPSQDGYADVTPDWLAWNTPATHSDLVLTTIMSAMEQGQRSPKQIEDAVKELLKQKLTGLGSLVSARKSSD